MNKSLLITLILAINFQLGFAQNNHYTDNTEGVAYIIIPIDDFLAEDGIKEVKSIIDKKGLTGVRVSQFDIEEVRFGFYPYLIVRRFRDIDQANAFVDEIDENTKRLKAKSIIFTQSNYRLFLKKRDIQEYKAFVGATKKKEND